MGKEEEFKDCDFLDDEEKMKDFRVLTKRDFLDEYPYLSEAEYDNTLRLCTKRGRGRPRKLPPAVMTIDNKMEGETMPFRFIADNKQKGFVVLDKKSGRKYYPNDKDNDFVLNAHGDLIQVCYGGDRAGESMFVVRKVKQEDFELLTKTKGETMKKQMKIILLTGILTVLLTSTANAYYYCPPNMSHYDCNMIDVNEKAEQLRIEGQERFNASQYGYKNNPYENKFN